MDMKKILQAMDGVSSKPVEGANDMKKFVSIINEGSNPHKVSLPVQMAMQHYQQPQTTQIEKKKYVKDGIRKFFREVETQTAEQIAAEQSQKRQLINQYASVIAERVLMKEGKSAREKWTAASNEREKKHADREAAQSKLPAEKRSGAAVDALEKHVNKSLTEKSTTEKQARTMAAAAHDPKFAKKLGIKTSVAKEFNKADTDTKQLSNAMKHKKKVKENEIPDHSMGFTPGPGGPGLQIDPGEGHLSLENQGHEHGSPHELGNADAYYGRPADHRKHDLTDHEHIRAYYHGYRAGEDMHDKSNYDESATNSLRKKNPCWKNYKPIGTKKKGGRTVPNCVPKN